jgi:hypothetical protein
MLYGLTVGETAKDIITKPFAFCLPDQLKSIRQFLFCSGFIPAFLWFVIFLFYPAPNFLKLLLIGMSAFFLGTIIYWVAVGYVFITRESVGLYFLFLLPMLFGIYICDVIQAQGTAIIILGAGMNYLIWRYWDKQNLLRRYCGKHWLGLLNSRDEEKSSRIRQAIQAEKKDISPPNIASVIDSFFVNQINNHNPGDVRQYLWGGLYRSIAFIIPHWKKNVLYVLLYFCFLVYIMRLAEAGIIFMVFYAVFFMGMGSKLDVRSNLLIDGGRKDRFWTALFLMTMKTLLAIGILIMVIWLIIMLIPFLPDFGFTDRAHPYEIPEFSLVNIIFACLFLVPLVTIFYTIMQRSGLAAFCLAMLLLFIGLPIYFSFRDYVNINYILISADILSWALSIAVLRHFCMRGSLIR